MPVIRSSNAQRSPSTTLFRCSNTRSGKRSKMTGAAAIHSAAGAAAGQPVGHTVASGA